MFFLLQWSKNKEMRTKVNPDDINTRDLIGWEALHQSKTDDEESADGKELSKTDGKESEDGKELTDGQPNKAADGKPKKAADGKFK